MNTQVTLTISEAAYKKAAQYASLSAQAIEDVLAEFTHMGADMMIRPNLLPSDPDPALDREQQAYLSLHPQLWIDYPHHFVAIQDGKVADYDLDENALWKRIEERYPEVFVWVTKIEPEPIQTLNVTSFRLIENS